MKGVKNLLRNSRFQTKHVKEALEKYNVPGKWDNYQNIYNLVEGRSKPKDPIIYFMFADMLEVDIVDIMNAYSDFDLSKFKTREALPLKENESEMILTNKYSNW